MVMLLSKQCRSIKLRKIKKGRQQIANNNFDTNFFSPRRRYKHEWKAMLRMNNFFFLILTLLKSISVESVNNQLSTFF